MSLEDLKSMGLLREETQSRLEGRVSVLYLSGATVVVLVACGMMIVGDGNALTGWGIALFLLGFFALIGANLRGVMKGRMRED